MKKTLILAATVVLGALLTASPASAVYIADHKNPAEEKDLYEIYNDMFCTDYTSSNKLAAERSLRDPLDWRWVTCEEGVGKLRVAVKYASHNQELGIRMEDGAYVKLLDDPDTGTTFHCIEFAADEPFEFVLKTNGSEWTSNTPENPNGAKDHFVAFDVSEYTCDEIGEPAYLIAFEDLNLGDQDYNDLVALVTCVRPIPEPASMLMLGLGGLGLAGLRRRRRK